MLFVRGADAVEKRLVNESSDDINNSDNLHDMQLRWLVGIVMHAAASAAFCRINNTSKRQWKSQRKFAIYDGGSAAPDFLDLI
jgi:hypothetical protein